MFSVVIADDEPLIIKGLIKMVDWDSLDAKVAGTCRNGEQLIRLIEELAPDIVISDISMPHQSGIDVIKYIKEKGLGSKVIFLSAYQKFEYAKQALRYGVVDYLLKPVTKEELEGSMIKAEQLLGESMPMEFFKEDKKSPQAVFRAVASEYEFKDLYGRFEELGVSGEGVYTGACFSVVGRMGPENRNELELLRFAVFKRLEEWVRKEKNGFCLKREAGFCHIIFFQEKGGENKTEEEVRKLSAFLRNEYRIKLAAGIGKQVDKLSDLKFAYKTAAFACNLYYFKQDEVISFDRVKKDYKKSFEDYSRAYETLVKAVLTRDPLWKEKLTEVLQLIGELHFGNRSVAENRCVALLLELLRELSQYCRFSDGERQQYESFVSTIRGMDTYQRATAVIGRYLEQFIEKNVFPGTGGEQETVREMKLYIRENYWQDINLKSMSGQFFMNQYYFSAFFKQKTGTNFKDYLVEVRMQKAMELLLAGHEGSMQCLAKAVGYKDGKTFSEKFRQHYGESPANYRKVNKE